MKNKKLFLDFDEDENVLVGLIKLKQKVPYHEFFFKVNQQNIFYFSRKKDLRVEDFSGYYDFPIFETFDEVTQNTFKVLINQSCNFERKERPIEGLFDLITEDRFFINKDVDLIIFSKEDWDDYSIINFPEEWANPMEEYQLCSEEELYQIILNYDE